MDAFTRACNVIESCETIEQVEVADKFCSLMVRQWSPTIQRTHEACLLVNAISRQREDLRIRSLVREEIYFALDRLGLL